jgi:hypothetical protein
MNKKTEKFNRNRFGFGYGYGRNLFCDFRHKFRLRPKLVADIRSQFRFRPKLKNRFQSPSIQHLLLDSVAVKITNRGMTQRSDNQQNHVLLGDKCNS